MRPLIELWSVVAGWKRRQAKRPRQISGGQLNSILMPVRQSVRHKEAWLPPFINASAHYN